MQKRNKILMIIVSTLLCLTLISSNILSGIYAKYATKSERIFSDISLKQFGVTVNMVVDETELESVLGEDNFITSAELVALKKVHTTKEALDAALEGKVWIEMPYADQIKVGINAVTIHNLPIRPGIGYDHYDGSISNEQKEKLRIYSELVKFEFSGTANVPLTVSMGTEIAYKDLNLTVPAEVCGKDNDTKYLPIGFNCFAYDEKGELVGASTPIGTAWRVQDATTDHTGADQRSRNIASNFQTRFDFTWDGSNKYATKDFEVNDKIVFYRGSISTPINAFSQGIYWPLNSHYSNSEVSDELGNKINTWLAEVNQDATITLTYTVKVEQNSAIPRT